MWLLSSFPRAYLRCFSLLCLYFPLCSFFAFSSNDSSLSPVLSLLPLSFIPSPPLFSFPLQSLLHVFHLSFYSFAPSSTPPQVLSHFCPTVSFVFASHIPSLISPWLSFPHPPSFTPITSSPLSHHVPSSAHFSILFPLYLTPLPISLWSVALLPSVGWSLTLIKWP